MRSKLTTPNIVKLLKTWRRGVESEKTQIWKKCCQDQMCYY